MAGTTKPAASSKATPFLTDVKTLRERARKIIEKGAVTQNYGLDPDRAIEILQAVLAKAKRSST